MGHCRDKNDEAMFFRKMNDWALYQANASWDNTYNLQFMDDFLLGNLAVAFEQRLSSPLFLKSYLGLGNAVKYCSVDNLDFRWGWKDPRNTLLLPLWTKLFPDAKFVHIYRNPVDVAESLSNREYQIEKRFTRHRRVRRVEMLMSKSEVYFHSARVKNIHEGIKLWEEYLTMAFDIHQYSDNFLHIKYEDFLQQPEPILQSLSQFLEVEYNSGLASGIIHKIDSSRSYAFLDNPDLTKVYDELKNRPLLKKLDYAALT